MKKIIMKTSHKQKTEPFIAHQLSTPPPPEPTSNDTPPLPRTPRPEPTSNDAPPLPHTPHAKPQTSMAALPTMET